MAVTSFPGALGRQYVAGSAIRQSGAIRIAQPAPCRGPPQAASDGFGKVSSASSATTTWLGADLEILPDGTLIKQVAGEGRIVGKLGSGGAREWLHRDSLASNKLISDDAGVRVQRSQYLAYGDRSGALTVDENGGPLQPESIGYIGERGDPDTNLMYLHARWEF